MSIDWDKPLEDSDGPRVLEATKLDTYGICACNIEGIGWQRFYANGEAVDCNIQLRNRKTKQIRWIPVLEDGMLPTTGKIRVVYAPYASEAECKRDYPGYITAKIEWEE